MHFRFQQFFKVIKNRKLFNRFNDFGVVHSIHFNVSLSLKYLLEKLERKLSKHLENSNYFRTSFREPYAHIRDFSRVPFRDNEPCEIVREGFHLKIASFAGFVLQEDVGEDFDKLAGRFLLFVDVEGVLDVVGALFLAPSADRGDVVAVLVLIFGTHFICLLPYIYRQVCGEISVIRFLVPDQIRPLLLAQSTL